MAKVTGLDSVVSQLKVEKSNLANQLRHVDAALAVLGKLNGGSSYTKPRRTLSASGRRRISAAAKARWAKVKQHSSNGRTGTATRVKRSMSASARRKIAAAQRARWAKWKATQKKAA